MKLEQHDLAKLRNPLLGMISLIALALFIAWWSNSEAQKATQERSNVLGAKNQIEQRLRQVRTEEQELKARAHTFQLLQNSGITGEEKRLDWMEMLSKIQREIRIPGMSYEFGAQAPLETVNGAGYAFFSSPMRVRLRLLHEGDLLNFLDRIQREASAMVLVRNCKLTRLSRAGMEGGSPAQLAAECELQWITVRRSSGKN